MINLFTRPKIEESPNYFANFIHEYDNPNNIVQKDDHCLIYLFNFDSIIQPRTIYIYTSPNSKDSYFILFEFDSRFLILKIKFQFDSHDLSFTKEFKEINGLRLFSKTSHFFRRNIDNELFYSHSDAKFVFHKNKVLVFLNSLGHLNFVDGNNIFFSINVFDLLPQNSPSFDFNQVKRFEIEKGK
jgi:hypothetical protein